MAPFMKGDRVRIARDNFPENGRPTRFLGRIGTVTAFRQGWVSVNGLQDPGQPHDPTPYGFEANEVELA